MVLTRRSNTMEEAKKKIKVIQGKVVSDKMDKTAVILVESRKTHPKFKKILTISSKMKIHDEQNECKEGDLVQASECRPLSRDKRHKLLKVISRAK